MAVTRYEPWQLENEDAIIWERDISNLDYVREVLTPTSNRRRPIPGWGYRVGYSTLRRDTPRSLSGWQRRVFYLAPHDRGMHDDPDGPYARCGAPCEAVDPRTVAPRRSWGAHGSGAVWTREGARMTSGFCSSVNLPQEGDTRS